MILPDARHFCTVVLGISVLSIITISLKGESKIKITKRNFIPTDLHLQHDLIYSFMR